MKAEISEVLVKDDGIIACQWILSNGRSCGACLPAGRYRFEGYIEYEGRRFLRLRDTDGGLKVVDERELAARGKGRVRRSYRKPRCNVVPDRARTAPAASVSPITAADRAEVRRRLRESIPDFLPQQYLGRYEEYGSVDSWTVFYSIERRHGEWIICCEGPDGEREAPAFADVEALIEDAQGRGYGPENLLGDLRRSRDPHLITLAHEVEEVATAKGWIQGGEHAQPAPTGLTRRPHRRRLKKRGRRRQYSPTLRPMWTMINDGRANIRPTNHGAMDAPTVRATPVIPAAAERSSGRTTAMTYDCLAGTSIWLMLKRKSKTVIASASVGIKGTRMRRTFDGKCVKTIVFPRPKRDASREANNAETPAKTLAPKKIAPSVLGFMSKRR